MSGILGRGNVWNTERVVAFILVMGPLDISKGIIKAEWILNGSDD